MNNTDISTSSKGKAPIFINGIKAYNKETLNDEICRLITTNIQLIINKMESEKVKVNLKTDKIQLFGKKNSLVVKKKELRTEIIILNVAGPSNVPIRRYQDLFLKSTQDKLKTKRPILFDNIKENFQRFLIKTRYY